MAERQRAVIRPLIMPKAPKELLKDALQLPEDQRAGLVAELLDSLDQAQAHGLRSDLFLKQPLPTDPSEREAALTDAALGYASALARGFPPSQTFGCLKRQIRKSRSNSAPSLATPSSPARP